MNLRNVRAGMTLLADGGFRCLREGERCEVHADEKGMLYIICKHGRHYLVAQVDDYLELVGLRLADQ